MTAVPYTYCCICARRPADSHEICTRGSGGLAEEWNQLRLCRRHHTEWHTIGWVRFVTRYPEVGAKVVAARARLGRTTESREGANA